jgi:AraC-like DNA-binding protein
MPKVVLPSKSQHPSRFRFSLQSPLGQISLSGFNPNHAYVAKDTFRTLGSYAITYLIDGEGTYEDAHGTSQKIVPGDCIFIFPKLEHRYGPGKGQRWTEFFLVFDGPLFQLWEELGILDQHHPIHHIEPIHYWLQKWESILSSSRKPGFESPMIEICRLQLVLSEVLLSKTRSTSTRDVRWASRACALLESDLHREVDLRSLAKLLNTSYDHFRKKFLKMVGVSPAQYRGRCQINRACEMISHGNLADKEIAEQLGFCDEFYFSRRFKEITGVSPRKFRHRILKN